MPGLGSETIWWNKLSLSSWNDFSGNKALSIMDIEIQERSVWSWWWIMHALPHVLRSRAADWGPPNLRRMPSCCSPHRMGYRANLPASANETPWVKGLFVRNLKTEIMGIEIPKHLNTNTVQITVKSNLIKSHIHSDHETIGGEGSHRMWLRSTSLLGRNVQECLN